MAEPEMDLDMLIRDVSSPVWERLLLAITGGEVPEVRNEAERQVRERLTRQVEEIRGKGGIVEIPHDWP